MKQQINILRMKPFDFSLRFPIPDLECYYTSREKFVLVKCNLYLAVSSYSDSKVDGSIPL